MLAPHHSKSRLKKPEGEGSVGQEWDYNAKREQLGTWVQCEGGPWLEILPIIDVRCACGGRWLHCACTRQQAPNAWKAFKVFPLLMIRSIVIASLGSRAGREVLHKEEKVKSTVHRMGRTFLTPRMYTSYTYICTSIYIHIRFQFRAIMCALRKHTSSILHNLVWAHRAMTIFTRMHTHGKTQPQTHARSQPFENKEKEKEIERCMRDTTRREVFLKVKGRSNRFFISTSFSFAYWYFLKRKVSMLIPRQVSQGTD